MFSSISQLGCREIALPTFCVRNTLSLEFSCDFFEDSFLIATDVAGFLPGLVLLSFLVSQAFRPECGPLGTLEFTTLADAILVLLLLPDTDNVVLRTVKTKLGLLILIAYPARES